MAVSGCLCIYASLTSSGIASESKERKIAVVLFYLSV